MYILYHDSYTNRKRMSNGKTRSNLIFNNKFMIISNWLMNIILVYYHYIDSFLLVYYPYYDEPASVTRIWREYHSIYIEAFYNPFQDLNLTIEVNILNKGTNYIYNENAIVPQMDSITYDQSMAYRVIPKELFQTNTTDSVLNREWDRYYPRGEKQTTTSSCIGFIPSYVIHSIWVVPKIDRKSIESSQSNQWRHQAILHSLQWSNYCIELL